jgi:signal transduction histidine kinase
VGATEPNRPDDQVLVTLGRLTRGALHELANPLLALTGSTELAFLDAEPGTKIHERLEAVRDMGAELTAIVRALQAFARLQHEPPALLSLAAAADDAVALVRRVGAVRGVELTVRRDAEPAVVAAPGVLASQLVELVLAGLAAPDRGETLVLVVSRDGNEAVAAVAGAGEMRLPVEEAA